MVMSLRMLVIKDNHSATHRLVSYYKLCLMTLFSVLFAFCYWFVVKELKCMIETIAA